jgi:hypothetical protein
MEYFCGTCNSTFPDAMILDKTTIIEQTDTHVLYEGNTFCPRCQSKSVYCTSNTLMIPKLMGSFVDRINGYGDKWDISLTRVSSTPRVTRIEKIPLLK